jgi:hypothetical protein
MSNGNFVPFGLPPGIQGLIDGVHLDAIEISYTPDGVQVLAVPTGGGAKVPLSQWRAAQKVAGQATELRRQRELYASRVIDRQVDDVVVPAAFADQGAIDRWLGGLTAEQRRAVTMTARDFRGRQAANENGDGA